MTLNDECRLSYYTEVAAISEEHHVFLVQNTDNGYFYVKKTLSVFNPAVIHQIKEHPVKDMPQIIEAVLDGEEMILIEEYIHGITLEDIIRKNGHLPESMSHNYFLQICSVVKQLHNMSPAIVHRDIKPSNIIITPDERAKLLDVNTTRFVSKEDKQDTVIMGTAGYAAPEQFGFTATDQKSDIYSLGVLLNRMLTGDYPKNVLPQNPFYRNIVEKCIQLDPRNRYSSIEEIENVLSRHCPKDVPYSWKRFLPPGYRSGGALKHFLSTIGYALLIDLCMTMEIKGTSQLQASIERPFMLLTLLMIVFFSGNYLDVQRYCPLTKGTNTVLRIAGVIITDILLFLAMLCVLVIALY